MGNGKESSSEAYTTAAQRVWKGDNIEVFHREVIEHPDGEFLGLLQLLEGLQRADISALAELSTKGAIGSALVRVWRRETVEAGLVSVVIQVDVSETRGAHGRVSTNAPETPDRTTVEVAGIELQV